MVEKRKILAAFINNFVRQQLQAIVALKSKERQEQNAFGK